MYEPDLFIAASSPDASQSRDDTGHDSILTPKMQLIAAMPTVFMSLAGEPLTDEGILAVNAIVANLYRRKGRSKNPSKKYRQADGAMVYDLVRAAAYDPPRLCFRPMETATFSGKRVGSRPFKNVFEDMVAALYVDSLTGFADPKKHAAGIVTRIRARDKLLRDLQALGINPANVDDHFKRHLSELVVSDPIRLSATRPPRQPNGYHPKARKMPVDTTDPIIIALAAEMDFLNEFSSRQKLEGASHEGFFRLFHNGDDPTFAWNKGGRMYSLGGGYQNMPKGERAKITINGKETVELDISASHLTILHGLMEVPLPAADPYLLPVLPREIVKSWVAMTLGHDKFHNQWSDRAKQEHGNDLQKRYPVKKVREIVLDHIPILRGWEENSIRWDDLQYVESRAVTNTVISLSKNFNVPSYPIYDSIIVRNDQLGISKFVLERNFERVVGIKPTLKIK